jgi:hypothetical protein
MGEQMESRQFRLPARVIRALEEYANRECSTTADALRRLVVDGLRSAGVVIDPITQSPPPALQAEAAQIPAYDPAHPHVTLRPGSPLPRKMEAPATDFPGLTVRNPPKPREGSQ